MLYIHIIERVMRPGGLFSSVTKPEQHIFLFNYKGVVEVKK